MFHTNETKKALRYETPELFRLFEVRTEGLICGSLLTSGGSLSSYDAEDFVW